MKSILLILLVNILAHNIYGQDTIVEKKLKIRSIDTSALPGYLIIEACIHRKKIQIINSQREYAYPTQNTLRNIVLYKLSGIPVGEVSLSNASEKIHLSEGAKIKYTIKLKGLYTIGNIVR